MNKKKQLVIVGLVALMVLILFPPWLAPLVHDNDSPRSALREGIYKDGHPYQSFFALILKDHYKDKDYGQRYNVYWYNHDSPTGDTATMCYTKETESGKYVFSCGTGP
ncbi:hypothetical protein ACOJQI_11295 [Bacillus salacetis]|uniref:hypothetical protein n=1 Tax=Bacillus salacetis TaxID=2315464 RepID=UPI003B9F62E5